MAVCECENKCGFEVESGRRFIKFHSNNKGKRFRQFRIILMQLCKCQCGEYAAPGSQFISGHNSRTDNPSKHRGQNKNLKANLCQCAWNCGEYAKPGKKYLQNHQNRGRAQKFRKVKSPSQICACNECQLYTQPGRKFIYGHNRRNENKISWARNRTKETDSRIKTMSESVKKKIEEDDEYRLELIRRIRPSKPNKGELALFAILQDLDENWIYVGHGTFNVESKIPDFINTRTNQIIEFQGCYWHSCPIHFPNKGIDARAFKNRQIIFQRNGYSSLEIWEHELEDLFFLRLKLMIKLALLNEDQMWETETPDAVEVGV